MKLDKLIESLPDELDGVLIESPENRRYFTGFPSSAGILIAAKAGSVFLTDSRYIEAARGQISCCEVLEQKKLEDQLPALAGKLGCKNLAFETSRVTVARARKLVKMLGDIRLADDDRADKIIERLRMRKTEAEVEKIKAAQRITESAFAHILGFIKPGVSERDVALELDFFMLKNGAEALAFETIIASGVNSSKPHAVPSEKIIENGDFVTLDFGAAVDGYRSDMTRTVAVGDRSEKQREVYSVVLAAQKAALSTLKPGVTCKAADAAARDIIRDAGFGSFFGHGTGHGVGIEIHEEPTLSPNGAGELEPGNVVTAEPGIYLPGEFGVRIEDMVLITADGCENLTHSPKEMIVVSGHSAAGCAF